MTRFAAAFLGFALISFAVYRPALDGPFVSDDSLFVLENPYVKGEQASLAAVLVPRSDAHFYTGGSYQPVTQLFLALEWRLFGRETRGYHIVNLALHALDAALLVLLLLGAGVRERAALLGGVCFALHPANVEVVAWISQSRSLLALGFALAALLALERRPFASVALFALALGAKASGAFALPMAAALLWTRGRSGVTRAQLTALSLWLVAFLAFAPLEWSGLATLKPIEARAYTDVATHLRGVASIGAHYLWMAATGSGLAAFHEPAPVRSWLDPWWLAGSAFAALFTWRIARGLARRRPEAAWWIGAAAAFVPVSQLAPFFFPMADRYLYFILPGLIGGVLLAGGDAPARAGRAAFALAIALLALFGLRAHERAALWRSEELLIREAAQRYPDGLLGHYIAAVDATAAGRHEEAISHLRASMNRGAYVVRSFADDPKLVDLHTNPHFRELALEMAQRRIAFTRALGARDQYSLRSIASGHYLRGELDLAIAALDEALARGGPLQAELEELVARLRRERDERNRAP